MTSPNQTRARIRRANQGMDKMMNELGKRFGVGDPPAAPTPNTRTPGLRYEADRQRAGLYEAERRLRRMLDRAHEYPVAQVAGSRITLPVERKFADLPSMQTYVDLVLAQDWPEFPRLGISRVPVVPSPEAADQNSAMYTGGRIQVPVRATNPATGTRWAMREVVVLHELAHHAMFVHRPGVPHHGAEFAGAFRTLLVGMMGPEMTLLFDVIFRDGGVRVA